jgi:hypothetical protein
MLNRKPPELPGIDFYHFLHAAASCSENTTKKLVYTSLVRMVRIKTASGPVSGPLSPSSIFFFLLKKKEIKKGMVRMVRINPTGGKNI